MKKWKFTFFNFIEKQSNYQKNQKEEINLIQPKKQDKELTQNNTRIYKIIIKDHFQ